MTLNELSRLVIWLIGGRKLLQAFHRVHWGVVGYSTHLGPWGLGLEAKKRLDGARIGVDLYCQGVFLMVALQTIDYIQRYTKEHKTYSRLLLGVAFQGPTPSQAGSFYL